MPTYDLWFCYVTLLIENSENGPNTTSFLLFVGNDFRMQKEVVIVDLTESKNQGSEADPFSSKQAE